LLAINVPAAGLPISSHLFPPLSLSARLLLSLDLPTSLGLLGRQPLLHLLNIGLV
jgi:hypothetical protein